jgi:uncharacterized protein
MKRVNAVSGLARFREEWDARKGNASAGGAAEPPTDGPINIEGTARCQSAAIYTPAAPEFRGSIEARVRPLVLFLVEQLGCITYSSCEGHPPEGEALMRGRHVGILPRDEADRLRLVALLGAAAEATSPAADRTLVDLQIREDVVAGDGPDVHCIDILFVAGSYDWPAYAGKVDEVQASFLEQLRARLQTS